MKYGNRERHLPTISGLIRRLSRNSKGSILIPVLVVGTFLIIITTALMARVGVNTSVNKDMNFTENSYLAARSGIKLLVDKSNSDGTFAQKVFQSAYSNETDADANPIVMDLGDLGVCNVSLTTTKELTNDSGTVVGKEITAKCTGTYSNDSQFVLKRKLTITKTTTGEEPPVTKVKPSAFQTFDDADLHISGGIEGDIMILGDGKLSSSLSRYGETPMHNVVCRNGLVVSKASDPSFFESLILGKYLSGSQIQTDKDISCGMEGVDNTFVYLTTQSQVGGVIRSTGDVLIDGAACIAYNNIYSYDGTLNADPDSEHTDSKKLTPITVSTLLTTTAEQQDGTEIVLRTESDGARNNAIVSEGNVYLNAGISTENGESDATPKLDTNGAYQLELASNKYGSRIAVFGDIVAQGDVYLSGKTIVYGNIYCGGNVIIDDGWVRVKGTTYCNKFDVSKAWNSCSNYFLESGSTNTIYSVETTDIADYQKSNPVYHIIEGESAKNVCDSKGVFDTVNSGARANFKSYTDGQLTPPTTVVPKTTKVDGFDVNVSELPVITTDQLVLKMTSDTEFDRVAFPSGSKGGNYSALYLPTGNTFDNAQGLLYITKSCVLQGDITENIYIDTSKAKQNIDIFVDGTWTNKTRYIKFVNDEGNGVSANGTIAVNDDDGQYRIRIFLRSGSMLDISNGRGIWSAGTGVTYGHSFTVEDKAVEIPFQMELNGEGYYNQVLSGEDIKRSPLNVDFTKVSRLYLFAEDESVEDFETPEIYFGGTGCFPGYIVAPSSDITADEDANQHIYHDGEEITGTEYPAVFGMLMCHYATFPSAASTYVKYDPRMVDPETKGLTGDELTAAQEIYDAIHNQFAKDVAGILVYDDDDDDDDTEAGAGVGVSTTVWKVTME